ncbi:Platelet-derived growth factor D [Bagarius yarrelli]|uniref:Platelet-derived growth factor D n=1 Tax=Bagarius yarrelli TaxID=175774 RepID=A0A556V7A5_BAGYA|nr:Platelet-derived growth factor D [Bagarius yarrelli]
MRSVAVVIWRAARLLALSLVCLPLVGARGVQVRADKSPRATSTRRDDLFRQEEVVMVTAGGQIQSPRYPNAYPRNLLLSWKLLAPPFTRVLLEFDGRFGLEEPENNMCRHDFVKVDDISESTTITWGPWCGRKAPGPITSKNNVIRITFKSDDFFVAKPGFKLYYFLLVDTPLSYLNNLEPVTVASDGVSASIAPISADTLDDIIAGFSTVEEVLKHLNPHSWRQDLNSIYTHTQQYTPRSFFASRANKVDLDRLYEDVRLYSCTPRNFSINLREELKATNAVFFPRCLLVKRCGGNCACGTEHWNSCTCSPSKTVSKLHEVFTQANERVLEKSSCIVTLDRQTFFYKIYGKTQKLPSGKFDDKCAFYEP